MPEKSYAPIVQQLVDYIDRNHLRSAFHDAVTAALSFNIPELQTLGISSPETFLDYMNSLLKWVPQEDLEGKDVYHRLVVTYFVLNQPSFSTQQTPIEPTSFGEPLSWFSKWLVSYAIEIGKFQDTPESFTDASLRTFYDSPKYKMSDYLEPRGGWKTFNEFFARNFKPGYRPIDGLCDNSAIVSPTDSTFGGKWHVDSNSIVKLKHIPWSVSELLSGSKYANEFRGGIFTHSFLNTFDYHRQHAPVGGKVLEATVIQGQVFLETKVTTDDDSGQGFLQAHRDVDAPDNPGYQFLQTRGLIVLDTPIGLVAVLPMGMAQVSSIIITAEVGRTLRKGEELSYFQFGGSDIVMVFQADSKVDLTMKKDTHYSMGNQIGTSGLSY